MVNGVKVQLQSTPGTEGTEENRPDAAEIRIDRSPDRPELTVYNR